MNIQNYDDAYRQNMPFGVKINIKSVRIELEDRSVEIGLGEKFGRQTFLMSHDEEFLRFDFLTLNTNIFIFKFKLTPLGTARTV